MVVKNPQMIDCFVDINGVFDDLLLNLNKVLPCNDLFSTSS